MNETQIMMKMTLGGLTRLDAIKSIQDDQDFVAKLTKKKVAKSNHQKALTTVSQRNEVGTFLVEASNGFAHYHNESGLGF